MIFVGGANGAGKTTLLRVSAGLITPDEGAVASLGVDPSVERRKYQRQLGWLPAGNGGLYNRLTVRQNLEYWASLALMPSARRGLAVESALATFALSALSGSRSDRISMGERQRLRLAMTFVHSPRLVLLDEPETSLDAEGLALLRNAMSNLIASGGGAAWCAPSRKGIDLPADRQYEVANATLREC